VNNLRAFQRRLIKFVRSRRNWNAGSVVSISSSFSRVR